MDNSDVINDGGAGEAELMKFAIKFKSPDLANEFKTAFETFTSQTDTGTVNSQTDDATKPTEKAEKAFTSAPGFNFNQSSEQKPPKDETPGEMVRNP